MVFGLRRGWIKVHKTILGNLVDAVKIQAANWYAAKRCADAGNGNDRWAEVDKKFMQPGDIDKRNALYEDHKVGSFDV